MHLLLFSYCILESSKQRAKRNFPLRRHAECAHGRSQAGIIDRLELAYLRHGHPQLQSGSARVEEGPVINSSELRIRLHRSRAELLPALNAAIAQLRRDGSLQRIMSRYAPPSQ